MTPWMSLLLGFAVLVCLTAQPVEDVVTAKKVPPLGGWFKKRPDSAEVQAAAQHALKTFNTNSRSKRLFKLVDITAAQSQVTNKINFQIQAILGKTKCLKAENLDPSSCPAVKKRMRCKFLVTFDPQNSQHQVQDQRCKNLDKKA